MPIPEKAVPRPDLGELAYERALKSSEQGFIAASVLPFFPTRQKSAMYPYIPEAAAIEHVETKRAPRSAYARSDFVFDFKEYACLEYGYEEPLDDVEAKHYASFFRGEQVATDRAMAMVLRDFEMRVAKKVQAPADFDHAAATKKWNNYAEANPLLDVVTGKRLMRKKYGIIPNALIINHDTYLDLGLCEAVLERINPNNPEREKGELSLTALATYFKVDRIIVAGGVVNAAAKGKTVDAKDIWDPDFAVLARLSSGGPDLREVALGRSMFWEDDTPDSVMVEEYRENQTRSNIYRARMHTDQLIQFKGAGYIVTGLV